MPQPVRTARRLADVDDPAWPHIAALAAHADSATVLDIERSRGEDVLHRLQVTARSYLGALALNCGGLLADHGWFRLLGGGSSHLPDLATANGLTDPQQDTHPPGALLVGHDALGGRFAIDGGALGVSTAEVCYLGPDTLTWQDLGGGHAQFVTAVLEGALATTFADLRWRGWQDEVAASAPTKDWHSSRRRSPHRVATSPQ